MPHSNRSTRRSDRYRNTDTPRVRRYTSTQQDFVDSPDQRFRIGDDWTWYHGDGLLHRIGYYLVLAVFWLVSFVYAHAVLHIRIIGTKKLRAARHQGYFMYANHTQPFGDICITVLENWPHRITAIMAQANFGIPVLGPILHHYDFLAVPKTDAQRAGYKKAMTTLVAKDHVACQVYPEAHVWPWATRIRPFTPTSMRYPVRYGVASFTSTTTYQSRGKGKTPRAVVYIDGPFYPRVEGDEETKKKDLHEQIYGTLVRRSRLSTVRWVDYEKVDEQDGDAAAGIVQSPNTPQAGVSVQNETNKTGATGVVTDDKKQDVPTAGENQQS